LINFRQHARKVCVNKNALEALSVRVRCAQTWNLKLGISNHAAQVSAAKVQRHGRRGDCAGSTQSIQARSVTDQKLSEVHRARACAGAATIFLSFSFKVSQPSIHLGNRQCACEPPCHWTPFKVSQPSIHLGNRHVHASLHAIGHEQRDSKIRARMTSPCDLIDAAA
jgi:hypothetical protein